MITLPIDALNSPTRMHKSGMETRILKVDEKGRLHLPKEIRDTLGIKNEVRARIKNGTVTIEPITKIMDRLATQVKFTFRSVEKELPSLRRVAEKQLVKEFA